ncbi:hypothetical protein Ddye_027442 [Dipteronia dyeriana]|uniref:KIB1-4 beta-propeller domain-containing protein n=1 Tax=Dipteronia dyeriana TaxID=168575 RepID=A0AAD9WRE9_9ROSI|nr:hypothetical protein Ddye_027442 [Dipteronia dyeriana]
MEWVKLDSLEEFSIFFGRNCTRCYSTKELGVDKGNCIYFTDECVPMTLIELNNGFSCHHDIGDWGIFRLISGQGNSDSGFQSFSYHAKEGKRTPAWLTAPLSWYLDEFRL